MSGAVREFFLMHQILLFFHLLFFKYIYRHFIKFVYEASHSSKGATYHTIPIYV